MRYRKTLRNFMPWVIAPARPARLTWVVALATLLSYLTARKEYFWSLVEITTP
jgi:hypothetical protein